MKKKKGKTDDTGDGVKKDDEEQSKRFTEKAETLMNSSSGGRFKEAIIKIKKGSDIK